MCFRIYDIRLLVRLDVYKAAINWRSFSKIIVFVWGLISFCVMMGKAGRETRKGDFIYSEISVGLLHQAISSKGLWTSTLRA